MAWTDERVELLKKLWTDGLSASQIAGELGVTRNAVMGKAHRIGLSKPKDLAAKMAQRQTKLSIAHKPRGPYRPRAAKLNIFNQREMLKAAFPEPTPVEAIVPIHHGTGCTLFELAAGKCKWPISEPGADSFRFCGSDAVEGLPYCLGHCRVSYRRSA